MADNFVKILVLFARPASGIILHGQGGPIEEELKQGHLNSDMFWSEEESPGHGLWIWEGEPFFFCDEDGGQYEFINGQWRIPTLKEWRHIMTTNIFEFPDPDPTVPSATVIPFDNVRRM